MSIASSLKTMAVLGLATTLSFGALAQTESTSTSTKKVKKMNKVKGDIDQEITNAKMRAESGSKSKFSGSISVGYDGGSVGDPLSAVRPNISGDPEVPALSEGGGSISARYRMDKNNSFTFGTGFSFFQPFQDSEQYENANEFTFTNPSVGYARIYKVGPFQTSTSASFTYGLYNAWENLTDAGTDLDATVGLSHTMMAQVPGTNLSAGISVGLTGYIYSDSLEDSNNQLALGIYPMAEYQLSDMFVARTVFGYFNYRDKRNTDALDFRSTYKYQSVGLGIVASRDIWIYPNLQFIPDNFDWDYTNVSISATINLF